VEPFHDICQDRNQLTRVRVHRAQLTDNVKLLDFTSDQCLDFVQKIARLDAPLSTFVLDVQLQPNQRLNDAVMQLAGDMRALQSADFSASLRHK